MIVGRRFLQVIIVCLLVVGNTDSYAANLGLGAKIGTLGYGLEVTTGLNNKLNARLGINFFNYQANQTEESIDYKANLKLNSIAALLDWHPTGGGFRFTGGMFINNNKLELAASGQNDYEIGNDTYTGNLQVNGTVGFLQTAPYFGLGWGKAPSKTGHWGLGIDLGVLYQGAPHVNLNASGTATRQSDGLVIDVTNDPTFRADLLNEEDKLQHDLKDFKFYPVLSLGIIHKF